MRDINPSELKKLEENYKSDGVYDKKVEVRIYDNAGNAIQQKVFDAVPLIINCITTCEGAFFGDLGGDIITDGNQMTIWADSPEWNDTIKISY